MVSIFYVTLFAYLGIGVIMQGIFMMFGNPIVLLNKTSLKIRLIVFLLLGATIGMVLLYILMNPKKYVTVPPMMKHLCLNGIHLFKCWNQRLSDYIRYVMIAGNFLTLINQLYQ